jgi:hypothetical protein
MHKDKVFYLILPSIQSTNPAKSVTQTFQSTNHQSQTSRPSEVGNSSHMTTSSSLSILKNIPKKSQELQG